MIKVLICDDHPMVRHGLKQIISTCQDIVVVGEADCCKETLKKVSAEACDVILLDVKMPDGLGLDIVEDILSIQPELQILMVSAYPEEAYALAALKSGACGYLVKESLPKELLCAIRDVENGRKYISSSLAERMTDYLQSDINPPAPELLVA